MNYVISLMKEIVRKRKLIWDLAKADFRKRFVEMLADLSPADWKLLEHMAEKLTQKKEHP